MGTSPKTPLIGFTTSNAFLREKGLTYVVSVLAVWIGRLTAFILRLTGRNATSLPGKMALRIDSRLLQKLSGQLRQCVVVTGTNGKTTTASLLFAMIKQSTVLIHNAEGANLPQGLTTALLRHTSFVGRLKTTTALFEIDEATLPLVAPYLPIQALVVTNVFRDQLDRYGELDTTIEKLVSGISVTQTTVILNADDPLAQIVGLRSGRPVVYFGLAKNLATSQLRDQVRDGAFCLQCGSLLEYTGFVYGQLGSYRCPQCGFHTPAADYSGQVIHGQLIVYEATQPPLHLPLPVSGMFNAYNALAAVACARFLSVSAENIAQGLSHYQAPLGRMQVFSTNPQTVLNLIKNPTGCDSVLQAIASEPGKKVLCVAINDLAADGKDVSWLWDADFELVIEQGQFVHCVATGLRAEDMALRLKYGGYPEDKLSWQVRLEDGLEEALAIAREQADVAIVHVLSTYTALYPLAQLLTRRVTTHEQALTHRSSVS